MAAAPSVQVARACNGVYTRAVIATAPREQPAARPVCDVRIHELPREFVEDHKPVPDPSGRFPHIQHLESQGAYQSQYWNALNSTFVILGKFSDVDVARLAHPLALMDEQFRVLPYAAQQHIEELAAAQAGLPMATATEEEEKEEPADTVDDLFLLQLFK